MTPRRCTRRWAALAQVIGLAACGPRVDGLDGDANDGTTYHEPTSGSAASFSEDSGSAETGQPPSLCPNGVVDPGEACDDGNRVDGDGCNHDCVVSGTRLWSVVTDDENCAGFVADAAGHLYLLSTGVYDEAAAGLISRFEPTTGAVVWRQEIAPPVPGAETYSIFGLRLAPGFATLGTTSAQSYGSWREVRDEQGELVFSVVDPTLQPPYLASPLTLGPSDDLWTQLNFIPGISLRRHDSDGAILWTTPTDPDPGARDYLGVAHSYVSDGIVATSMLGSQKSVSRLSSTGEVLWVTEVPTAVEGDLADMTVIATGDVLVAVTQFAQVGEPEGTLEVRRYSPDGKTLGAVELTSPQSSVLADNYYGPKFEVDANGDLLLASLAQFLGEDTGKNRWFVGRYDAQGHERWAALFPPLDEPGYGTARLCGLVVIPQGPLVVATATNGGDQIVTVTLHAFAP